MKTYKKTRESQGFTIIELMIATTVFSTLLLLITFSVIELTSSFYKGIDQGNTQNTARNISTAVDQSIQFDGLTSIGSGSSGTEQWLCVGSQIFVYQIGVEYTGTSGGYIIQQQSSGVCPTVPPSLSTGTELLGANMRLAQFSISADSLNTDLYDVQVQVAFGNNGLISTDPHTGADSCTTHQFDQYCAVATLNSTVEKRTN